MGRFVELIVCGILLWLFLESWLARITGRGRRRTPAPPPRAAAPRSQSSLTDVTLVRCAACGIHLPQSRTLAAAGALYCSERCRSGATGGASPRETSGETAGKRSG